MQLDPCNQGSFIKRAGVWALVLEHCWLAAPVERAKVARLKCEIYWTSHWELGEATSFQQSAPPPCEDPALSTVKRF